jgi:endonuclease/exonuclease/phosphatase family metal-dependent hydrolase
LATVDVERGFVGVDAMIDGKTYRFVNTHLEVRYPAPIPDSRFIQSAQAEQLLGTLAAVPLSSEAELLVVGDINSDSEDEPVETIYGTAFPPYMQLATFYTDVWNLRPGNPKSLTCCQWDDLSNHKSVLYERIDVIFSLNPPSRVKAKVLGDRIGDKTASDLWPSDHASVSATLSFD